MRKLLVKYKILALFITWRVSLFAVAALSPFFIPKFGNVFPYADLHLISTKLPQWIWGFGNFDGVQYLVIAKEGYYTYNQAFFPLFPILIHFLTINGAYLITGLILSNLFFLLSLFMMMKLFMLDFSEEISFKAIVLFICFPTSFYLGAYYSESLFILLVTTAVYLIRKNKFILGGLVGGFLSITRILGFLITPVILLESYFFVKSDKVSFNKGIFLRVLISLFLSTLGVFAYSIYLKVVFNNPIYFLTAQSAFGAGRSSHPFILLPQVFIRYFKIFQTVPFYSLPFLNSLIEFMSMVFALALLIILFKKVRLSYILFILFYLILPTLTGTLLSMPRFVLVLYLIFPAFVELLGRRYKITALFFVLFQIILLSMFIRGYWVA